MAQRKEKPIVVIAGTRFPDQKIERKILAPAGCKLIAGNGHDEKSLIELCREADGVITGSLSHFTPRVIQRLDRCRIIARVGIGLDNIDLAAAKKKGIIVTNVPDYCIDEVSEHAMAFVLSFSRQIQAGAAEAKRGGWGISTLQPVPRLKGAALGVIGIGRIGSALAKKARTFGMRIIAHDPFAPDAAFKRIRAEKASIAKILKGADYISLHSPLTPKTRGMIGAAELKTMKTGAVLINVARGGLIDEKALASALKRGTIRGAALDVLSQEPPPKNHPLIGLENCIITPHSAWYTTDALQDMREKSASEVMRVLTGKKPKYRAV